MSKPAVAITRQRNYPKFLNPLFAGVPIPNDLSPIQVKFAQEYCSNGGNGTRAAIAAGYAESSAHNQANRLKNNPKVTKYIGDIRTATEAMAVPGIEVLMTNLGRIALGQIEGTPVSEMTKATLALLSILGVDVKGKTEKSNNNEVTIKDAADKTEVTAALENVDWEDVEYDEYGQPIGVVLLNENEHAEVMVIDGEDDDQ